MEQLWSFSSGLIAIPLVVLSYSNWLLWNEFREVVIPSHTKMKSSVVSISNEMTNT